MKEKLTQSASPPSKIEHLSRAPIVEAVIELRSRVELPQSEDDLKRVYTERMREYAEVRVLRSQTFKMSFTVAESNPPEPLPGTSPPANLEGLRMEHREAHQVVVCARDRFVFSRLAPYETWSTFHAEAMRLWEIHKEIGKPLNDIQRMGVRFINRLEVPSADDPADYFVGLGPSPNAAPRQLFFHRDVLEFPDRRAYQAVIVRTVQPVSDDRKALLLDVDVYIEEALSTDRSRIDRRLAEMRTMKNELFFASITEKVREMCR